MVSQIVRRFFQNAYLGYYGHKPFDRQGYMTEGMQLVLRHAFSAMKLHRLEANVQPERLRRIVSAHPAAHGDVRQVEHRRTTVAAMREQKTAGRFRRPATPSRAQFHVE